MQTLKEKQIKDINITLNEEHGEYIVITDGLMVYNEEVFDDYRKALKTYEKVCKAKFKNKNKHKRISESGF